MSAERIEWERHGDSAVSEWLQWIVVATIFGIAPISE